MVFAADPPPPTLLDKRDMVESVAQSAHLWLSSLFNSILQQNTWYTKPQRSVGVTSAWFLFPGATSVSISMLIESLNDGGAKGNLNANACALTLTNGDTQVEITTEQILAGKTVELVGSIVRYLFLDPLLAATVTLTASATYAGFLPSASTALIVRSIVNRESILHAIASLATSKFSQLSTVAGLLLTELTFRGNYRQWKDKALVRRSLAATIGSEDQVVMYFALKELESVIATASAEVDKLMFGPWLVKLFSSTSLDAAALAERLFRRLFDTTGSGKTLTDLLLSEMKVANHTMFSAIALHLQNCLMNDSLDDTMAAKVCKELVSGLYLYSTLPRSLDLQTAITDGLRVTCSFVRRNLDWVSPQADLSFLSVFVQTADTAEYALNLLHALLVPVYDDASNSVDVSDLTILDIESEVSSHWISGKRVPLMLGCDTGKLVRTKGKSKERSQQLQQMSNEMFELAFWLYISPDQDDFSVPIISQSSPPAVIANPEDSQLPMVILRSVVPPLSGKRQFSYEVTSDVSQLLLVGWINRECIWNKDSAIDVHTVKGTDSVFMYRQSSGLVCVSIFDNPEIELDISVKTGDVLFCMIDMDANAISFVVNEDIVFSSSKYCSPCFYGKDFYPFFGLGLGETGKVAFQKDAMRFKHSGFLSVAEDYNEGLAHSTFHFQRYQIESKTWFAAEKGPHGYVRCVDSLPAQSLALVLQSNLHLEFSVSCTSGSGPGTASSSQYVCVSRTSLPQGVWTHVIVRRDEDSIDFVFDGELDSEHFYGNRHLGINRTRWSIGDSCSNVRFNGTVLICNLKLSFGLSGREEIYNQRRDPAWTELFRSVSKYVVADDRLTSFLTQLPTPLVLKTIAIVSIAVRLACTNAVTSFCELAMDLGLDALRLPGHRKEAAKAIMLLSETLHGRIRMIKRSAMLTFLLHADTSKSPLNNHFYLERAMANLYITDEETHLLGNGQASSSLLYFPVRSPAQARQHSLYYDPESIDAMLWREFNFGLLLFANNPAVFAQLFKALTSDSLTSVNAQSRLQLLKWCIKTFVLLTRPSDLQLSEVDSAQMKVLDPHVHPYPDSEDKTGSVLFFEDVMSIRCSFDPLCSTEQNYDYLQLFEDAQMSRPIIKGTGADPETGKFTGRKDSSTCYTPFTLPFNSFHWKWYSDGSGNDWGIRMFLTPEKFVPGCFQDSKMLLQHLIAHGVVDCAVSALDHLADSPDVSHICHKMIMILTDESVGVDVGLKGGLRELLLQLEYHCYVSSAPIGIFEDSSLSRFCFTMPATTKFYVKNLLTNASGVDVWQIFQGSQIGFVKADPPETRRQYVNEESLTLLGNMMYSESSRTLLFDKTGMKLPLALANQGNSSSTLAAMRDAATDFTSWLRACSWLRLKVESASDGSRALKNLISLRLMDIDDASINVPLTCSWQASSGNHSLLSHRDASGNLLSVSESESFDIIFLNVSKFLSEDGGIIKLTSNGREIGVLQETNNTISGRSHRYSTLKEDSFVVLDLMASSRIDIKFISEDGNLQSLSNLEILLIPTFPSTYVPFDAASGALARHSFELDALEFLFATLKGTDATAVINGVQVLGRLFSPQEDKHRRMVVSPYLSLLQFEEPLLSILQLLLSPLSGVYDATLAMLNGLLPNMATFRVFAGLDFQGKLKDHDLLKSFMAFTMARLTATGFTPSFENLGKDYVPARMTTQVVDNKAVVDGRMVQKKVFFPGALRLHSFFEISSEATLSEPVHTAPQQPEAEAENVVPPPENAKTVVADRRVAAEIFADEQCTDLRKSVSVDDIKKRLVHRFDTDTFYVKLYRLSNAGSNQKQTVSLVITAETPIFESEYVYGERSFPNNRKCIQLLFASSIVIRVDQTATNLLDGDELLFSSDKEGENVVFRYTNNNLCEATYEFSGKPMLYAVLKTTNTENSAAEASSESRSLRFTATGLYQTILDSEATATMSIDNALNFIDPALKGQAKLQESSAISTQQLPTANLPKLLTSLLRSPDKFAAQVNVLSRFICPIVL